MLHNRDLVASILLFVVLGFGLYGGVVIFPLFTQSILGFSPTQTGLAMMPGGIATAIMALACGRMLSGNRPLVDPRILILSGMALMLFAMWTLGHLSTAAGEADARYALILRGLALGLLFTPINNVAFGNLKPEEAQQASGLINLARQLGGSFGIAVLGAYLTRHIAYHRADLVTEHVSRQPGVRRALRWARRGAFGSGPVARRRAATRAGDTRRDADAAGVDAGVQRCLAAAAGVASSASFRQFSCCASRAANSRRRRQRRIRAMLNFEC